MSKPTPVPITPSVLTWAMHESGYTPESLAKELKVSTEQLTQQIAEQVVGQLHLNPANRYPRIIVDAAAALTEPRLKLLAIGAAAYALVRFVEAYGLWRSRRWAEWFAAISRAIYIPLNCTSYVTKSVGSLLERFL